MIDNVAHFASKEHRWGAQTRWSRGAIGWQIKAKPTLRTTRSNEPSSFISGDINNKVDTIRVTSFSPKKVIVFYK
jgi:hypothetical protein